MCYRGVAAMCLQRHATMAAHRISICQKTGVDHRRFPSRQGPGTSAAAVDKIRAAVAAGQPVSVELLNYRKVRIGPCNSKQHSSTAVAPWQCRSPPLVPS